jgi:hypothetical protein
MSAVWLYFNLKEEKSATAWAWLLSSVVAEERRHHAPSRHTHQPRLQRITALVIATSLAIAKLTISDVADIQSIKMIIQFEI